MALFLIFGPTTNVFIFYLRLDLTKMGEYVHYQDKDGVYWKIFASYNGSLQDLTFTRNDLDLKDENILCIFDPIESSGLSLHR